VDDFRFAPKTRHLRVNEGLKTRANVVRKIRLAQQSLAVASASASKLVFLGWSSCHVQAGSRRAANFAQKVCNSPEKAFTLQCAAESPIL